MDEIEDTKLKSEKEYGHWVGVPISIELWQELITTGWLSAGITEQGELWRVKCQEGLPKGAIFHHSYVVDEKAEIVLVFEHPSFQKLEPGQYIPLIFPKMTREIVELIEVKVPRSEVDG